MTRGTRQQKPAISPARDYSRERTPLTDSFHTQRLRDERNLKLAAPLPGINGIDAGDERKRRRPRVRRTDEPRREGGGKGHSEVQELTHDEHASSARAEGVHGGRNRRWSSPGSEKGTAMARRCRGSGGDSSGRHAPLGTAETMRQATVHGELHSGRIDSGKLSRVSGEGEKWSRGRERGSR